MAFLCRALLALSLIGAFGAEAMAEAPPGTYRYKIERSGSVIGTQTLTVGKDGDKVTVSDETAIKVKVAFVTAYTLDHSRRETWQDGKLTALETRLDDNGTKSTLTAKADGDKLAIKGSEGDSTQALGIMPTGYWNVATVKQTKLFDNETGKILNISVSGGEAQKVDLGGGRTIDAKKWQMAGDKKMELWYDSRDVLVKQRFEARDGSVIVYTIQE
ncbi:MAG: DUF6134 family protein [Alphaproteobacteria bacterium]|nr:DUF6134 family protein [Alphaproteobacteria bacterium]